MTGTYDVIILGGGLSGLTLAMQLKRTDPNASILVLESRDGAAPEAAHKVGESTVELGTYYLREVLGLGDYLDQHQLPKHGLRFFFTPEHKERIELRAELGTRERLPTPSHQIDRGIFENELIERNRTLGNEILTDSRVSDIDLNADGHTIGFKQSGAERRVTATWVVDATGRRALLKNQLGFRKPLDHVVNAAWFRLDAVIDVQEWTEDEAWRAKVKPGLRRLGTVHLMGKGYWVWLIPLVSNTTSIGIVADPSIHPFDNLNSLDKAMAWLTENEPLCARMLKPKKNTALDFRMMKHYAHDSGRFYSRDRWGVTGDAGAFLDPFYSPGTDFIAMNNTWLCDLITRDLAGEDVGVRASFFERTHAAVFRSWVPIYQNKYPLMGRTQLMIVKIFWDWAVYWGIPVLLFANDSFIDLDQLKRLSIGPDSVLQRLTRLNETMQAFFMEWAPHDTACITNVYIDPYDLGFLREFHQGMETRHEPAELIAKAETNMSRLENVAAEIFRCVNTRVNQTSPDLTVDPYAMTLSKPMDAPDGLGVDASIRDDVKLMFFQEEQTYAGTYS